MNKNVYKQIHVKQGTMLCRDMRSVLISMLVLKRVLGIYSCALLGFTANTPDLYRLL